MVDNLEVDVLRQLLIAKRIFDTPILLHGTPERQQAVERLVAQGLVEKQVEDLRALRKTVEDGLATLNLSPLERWQGESSLQLLDRLGNEHVTYSITSQGEWFLEESYAGITEEQLAMAAEYALLVLMGRS